MSVDEIVALIRHHAKWLGPDYLCTSYRDYALNADKAADRIKELAKQLHALTKDDPP